MLQAKSKNRNKIKGLIKFLIFGVFFVLATRVQAGVEISEVAWMGTVVSASDEWIELYSASGSNLEGWVLKTADGGMTINLSGNILSGGYFLIERTDDTTVPNVNADLITPFGNGLNNSGEILILQNASGGEEDRIDASSGWPAGDNTTKETMQKMAGVWQTQPATPKAAPPGTSSVSNPASSSAPASESVGWVEEKEKEFKAVINASSLGIAGADLVFEGRVYAESGTEISAERYFWNFGDGGSANGKKLLHVFFFPGKYQVSFSASVNGKSVAAYKEIEILENKLVISEVQGEENSWIKLSNSAPQKLNLSRWMLRSGGETFIFPEETYILSKAVLTIAGATAGLTLGQAGEVELLYPNGTLAQRFSYTSSPKSEVKAASPPQVSPFVATISPAESPRQDVPTLGGDIQAGPPQPESLGGQAASPFLSRSFYSWGIGVLGLGLLAAFGYLASRRIQ